MRSILPNSINILIAELFKTIHQGGFPANGHWKGGKIGEYHITQLQRSRQFSPHLSGHFLTVFIDKASLWQNDPDPLAPLHNLSGIGVAVKKQTLRHGTVKWVVWVIFNGVGEESGLGLAVGKQQRDCQKK